MSPYRKPYILSFKSISLQEILIKTAEKLINFYKFYKWGKIEYDWSMSLSKMMDEFKHLFKELKIRISMGPKSFKAEL
jgi:hypothetical protein